tara:strand:- start:791 stop:1510 length:720 start_codon:yes stop_codon:yes gene_type:complete
MSCNGIKASLLAIAFISLSGLANAQDVSNSTRSITVIGQGEAAGPPDRASINAGVQTLAPSVAESSEQNQAIIERIMAALKQEGIEAADIQTADYSVWPEQQHDPRGSGEVTITGYRVNNTVRITVKDIDRLGKVLAAVTSAGANAIHGIGFSVKDTAALEGRARAAAMQDARARAEALAGLAGVELGKVLSISATPGGNYPMPMMGGGREMMMSASVPGISSGQLSINVQVQVSYEIL